MTLDSSFERISDDEERAMNGEMFKDARLQERLLDEVHAAEFDMEDLPSAPVGSLLSDRSLTDSGSFQRIADDDDATGDSTSAPLARARELEAARVRDFVDEVAEESSRSLSFERVSDDEVAEAPRRKSPRKVRARAPLTLSLELGREAPAAKKPARRSPTTTRKKKPGVIDRLFKSRRLKSRDEPETETPALEATEELFPDSEASITTGRVHEEFATRRGGRRRRPVFKTSPERAKANGADGEEERRRRS